ncbi:hypothetical protein [Streptomyces violascens]|uniref:Uncharacterized protein n=1 Tax=Streptomyces violascens TaxID=67381 RepID=A0ABQ3QX86_9ACTN|nr:hypothetical protein [Streptomyces violascens]GHI41895.1 hypothetical protein Sviol_63030 [Streptomyces violascens]
MAGQKPGHIAVMLDKVASTLENSTGLNPDQAVRLAIWGDADTPDPEHGTPSADMFREITVLIACHIANEDGMDPRDSIAWIPPHRAAAACRAGARRWWTIAARG